MEICKYFKIVYVIDYFRRPKFREELTFIYNNLLDSFFFFKITIDSLLYIGLLF